MATAKKRELARSAFDCAHVKSVSAWALLFPEESGKLGEAGKMVANWSDNPNGSVCTATLAIWDGPLKDLEKCTGQAGGYGYDKLSAAFVDALQRSNFETLDVSRTAEKPRPMHAAGKEKAKEWLTKLGYMVIEVI